MKGVHAFLFLLSVMIITIGLMLGAYWLVRHSIEPYQAPR